MKSVYACTHLVIFLVCSKIGFTILFKELALLFWFMREMCILTLILAHIYWIIYYTL